MGGEHLDVVRQLEDLGLDGGTELLRRRLRLIRTAEQVRAGQVTHRQRPARQEQGRLISRRLTVVDQQADVLRCVPRGVEHLKADLAQVEALTITQRPVVEPDIGDGGREDLDVAPLPNLSEAG